MTSRAMTVASLVTAAWTFGALCVTSPVHAKSNEDSMGQLRYVYGDDGEKITLQGGQTTSTQIVTETRRINLYAAQEEANIKDPKRTTKRVPTKFDDCGHVTASKTVPVEQQKYENGLVDVEQTIKRVDTTTELKGGYATFGITSRSRGIFTDGEDLHFESVVGDRDLHLAKISEKTSTTRGYWGSFLSPLNVSLGFNLVSYNGLPSDNYEYNMNNSSASKAVGTGGSVGDVSSNSVSRTGAITNSLSQTNDQNAYLSSWTEVEQDLTAKINSTNIANAAADSTSASNAYANRPNGNGGCKTNKWGQQECNY